MLTDYFRPILIERRTGGQFTASSWVTVGTYRGLIQPVGGNENFKQGRAGEDVTHRLYTPQSTPGEYLYRVTQDGKKYMMIFTDQVKGITGINGHHKEILLGEFR